MKEMYIDLFKKIYAVGELTIEPLGIKIKNLDTDTLATYLFPILELKHPEELTIPDIDVNRLKEVYNLYLNYKEKNYVRVAAVGSDALRLYNDFTRMKKVIEDELNQTIIKKDEVYFTIVNEVHFIRRIMREFNVLTIFYSFTSVSTNNGILEESIAPKTGHFNQELKQSEIRKGLNRIPKYLFHTLVNSMGFVHRETNAIEVFMEVKEEHVNKLIENVNSKFVKSYISKMSNNLDNFGHRERVGFYNELNTLLDAYPIEKLLDFSFDEAVKLYV